MSGRTLAELAEMDYLRDGESFMTNLDLLNLLF